jgi:hypothetical protein
MSTRRRRRQQQQNQGPQSKAAPFWSDNGYEPGPSPKIRPTSEPGALPRSLGDPPLAPAVTQHHLDAVYEEAVKAATALAAANGLVAAEADADGSGSSDGD